MAMSSKITELFDIDYPIIAGGMVWCSGWELAAAVSNAGGLGLIGAGSMTPEVLREHIVKCREATVSVVSRSPTWCRHRHLPSSVSRQVLMPSLPRVLRLEATMDVRRPRPCACCRP